jgi:DNA repair exonuclease SbcCD nuclease subunit
MLFEAAPRYKKVFYIMGNHEYYGGDLLYKLSDLFESVRKYNVSKNNIRILHNSSDLITDSESKELCRITGSTLWTDFYNKDPLQVTTAKFCLNDFTGNIKFDEASFTIDKCIEVHDVCKTYLKWTVERADASYKDIIVTHHMPSRHLVADAYKDSPLNGSFASDCDEIMSKAKLWICGHSHHTVDTELHGCRVVMNPRGYPHENNKGFNPELVIEI